MVASHQTTHRTPETKHCFKTFNPSESIAIHTLENLGEEEHHEADRIDVDIVTERRTCTRPTRETTPVGLVEKAPHQENKHSIPSILQKQRRAYPEKGKGMNTSKYDTKGSKENIKPKKKTQNKDSPQQPKQHKEMRSIQAYFRNTVLAITSPVIQ